MIIARFLAVCGEGTHNYGIFDDRDTLVKKYKRLKKELRDSQVDIRKCYYRKVEPFTIFSFDRQKFILIKPIKEIKKEIEYEIEFDKKIFGDTYQMQKGDFLLINLSEIGEEEIQYGYMVHNQFICYSESCSYFEKDTFYKFFPKAIKLLRKHFGSKSNDDNDANDNNDNDDDSVVESDDVDSDDVESDDVESDDSDTKY